MKIQEIEERKIAGFSDGQPLGRSSRGGSARRGEGMGLRVALLGVVCVAGVFAMLGLLYTFG